MTESASTPQRIGTIRRLASIGISCSRCPGKATLLRSNPDAKTLILYGNPEREGFEPSIPLDAVYRISRKRT